MIRTAGGAVAGPSRAALSAGASTTRAPRASFSTTCIQPSLLVSTPRGKGKQRAQDCFSCQRRSQQTFIRTHSPTGSARIQLKSTRNGVFGLSTSRGTRAYQEDTASVSCLHIPTSDLRADYLRLQSSPSFASTPEVRQAALEWDPTKAGGEEVAGQVVWFGCFDGHGGQQVSSFLRDQLHKTFESVEPDMVTDTVQWTRELGGYFRRFMGGVLERWVRKERLKPVRAGAMGRRVPLAALTPEKKAESSKEGQSGSKEGEQQPSSKTLLQPTRQDGAVKIGGSADALTKSSSSTAAPTGSADAGWDELITRIPPPDTLTTTPLSISERLTLAWLVADRQIQSNPTLDVGGSTASVALLHSLDLPSTPFYSATHLALHVAHVGDTRMLLCSASDGKAIPLTSYHHPDDRSESERLRKMGAGMITDSFGEARWMGALANTRAFGDSRFKKVGITVEPEIWTQVIRGEDYGFVIGFSDGVGGVMSDQEVVDLCRGAKHPSQAAQSVLSFAEELGAQDNCTVMVIPLKGWGKVGGQDKTRERREMRRSKIDVFRDNRR
ncbi:Protein phosphatase 2C (PP2C)-like domain protein [Kalmanozyma brasiliensis GHG001]|uniref:Protein phosphatase Mg+2 or Mn+2 dependent-PPM n=1 Tax=Kalmanozyma brasiliensis (strain GHG001) TaxID=1365824 RepID=V5F0F1_KALBG|nr:Protein phosphatase 2C (PP2C)-like domain protein [Kalmanozyma brasiliensis GHG001]EST08684.1 Protein phosphatase 2C (PP2C)-like domain protein [Kalmanozyma brasiliensis GHG001]